MDDRHREITKAANETSARPIWAVALNQALSVPAPAEFRLLSLETWTTFFAVRWFFGTTKGSDEIDLRLQAGLDWQATDGSGAVYLGGDYGGGGGNSLSWTMTSWFAPPLAPSVASLSLSVTSPVDGERVTVDIDGKSLHSGSA